MDKYVIGNVIKSYLDDYDCLRYFIIIDEEVKWALGEEFMAYTMKLMGVPSNISYIFHFSSKEGFFPYPLASEEELWTYKLIMGNLYE